MKNGMRVLTDIEKKLNNKSIERLKEEKHYLEYARRHAELMLTEGLYMNFKMQLHEYQLKKAEVIKEIFEIDKKIIELERQNKDGVKPKEDKK